MPEIPSDADEEPAGSAPAHWKFGTTADVGIGARGGSPEELFAQLGQGLTDLVTDRRKLQERAHRALQLRASTLEGLVVAYLTELLGWFDEEGFLGSRFEVRLTGDPPTGIAAWVHGEVFDPGRHPLHVQVKAVTLHRLQVDLARGRARVLVDI